MQPKFLLATGCTTIEQKILLKVVITGLQSTFSTDLKKKNKKKIRISKHPLKTSCYLY